MSENKAKKKHPIRTYVARFFIVFFTTLLMIVIALYLLMLVIAKGPSETVKKRFVCSVTETSALKFLANWYYSDEKIAEYVGQGINNATDEKTDVSLVQISSDITTDSLNPQGNDPASADDPQTELPQTPLELLDISGSTYKGKMMLIHDPSRVFVGVSGSYGANYEGRTVMDMMNSYGAIGATNAGGFEDNGGVGNGGIPNGLVISEGQLRYGNLGWSYNVIGFDNNNIFHCGKMTGQQALDLGIRDAVCWGPMLIVNGKPQNIEKPLEGGLNPRTAIGQTSDGTVILVVIDGRQASSLGATYDDLVTIMQQHGAVNAANLDGGSSSHMIFNGEIITTCSSLYGPRKMPTCILIKP